MTAERFAIGVLLVCLVAIGGLFVWAIAYSLRMLGPDGEPIGLLAIACLAWFGALLQSASRRKKSERTPHKEVRND